MKRCRIMAVTTTIKGCFVFVFSRGLHPMVIRSFRAVVVALASLALSAPWHAFAVDYTWNVLAGGSQAWTTSANWLPNTGAPTTADDTANLSVGLATNLTTDVGAADVSVGGIAFGGTTAAVTTDVSSSGGNLILVSTTTNALITSGGVAGSVNRITAPVLLNDTVDIATASTRDFTIAGNLGLINANQILNNLMTGGQTLTIGSGSFSTIMLYDALVPATTRTLQINPLKSDPGLVPVTTVINARWTSGGSLALGGNNQQNPAATYVLMQSQTSTAGVTINRQGYLLAADDALGRGQVTMSNNNTQNWGAELRSDNDARVLNNTRLQMGNPIAVTGSNSLTINATLGQSNNNRAFGNALPAGKQLTLAGGTASPAIAITTASDNVGRVFTIDGPGTTIVSGSVVNALDPAFDATTQSRFIKRGTGRVELNNPLNTISGTITAAGGLLVFGTNGSFGTTVGILVTEAGGVSYAPGTADAGFTAFATKLSGSSAGFLALPLSNASSNLDFSGTNALAAAPGLSVVGDGNMTYTGVVTPGVAGYNWGGLSGTLTLGGNASVGANAVTYKNGGTVILTGSQSYSGVTTIQGATMLTAQNGITTRSGNSFTGTSAITFASVLSVSQVSNAGSDSTLGSSAAAATNLVIDGGVLRHTGVSSSSTDRLFTIGARGATLESTGAGAVTVGSAGGANLLSGTGARTLTVGGAGAARNTVASQLTNGTDVVNDVLSLTKAGAGTWVLSANNTYTGSTSVTAGSLFINGDQALATGAVAVAAGATLGGSGTIGGVVSLASAATLSPGSGPGTLTLGQSLSLVSGGNYNWQMLSGTGVAGASNAWDLLAVTGSLSIDSTSVDPFKINLWTLSGTSPDTSGNAANFNSALSYTWTIATAAGGISGFDATKFQIMTSATNGTGGFSNNYGSGTFSIAQSGNDLNLVFTAGAAPSVITINVASGTQTQTAAGYPLLSGSTPVLKTGAGTLVVDQANTLTGSTTVQGGRLQLAGGAALGSSRVVPLAGGTVTLTPALQTTVGGLAPSAGGLVDVGNGMVTVAAGLTAPDMVAAIVTGLGDGSWNGASGITSSVAATSGGDRTVGWLDNGDGSVTFAFAAAGDTNLDWQVDILDAANFLSGGKFDSGSPASWNEGDFTYDGVVDILDAASFLSTGLFDAGPYNAAPGTAGSVAAVPEPSTWALLAVAAGLTLAALRRRQP
jgi:autotransporter-associated beta strand protein